jgi:hypothetical protein
MKLTPEELPANNYILIDKMDHLDIMPFVKANLRKKTFFSAMYYLSMFIPFGLLVFYCLTFHRSGILVFHKSFSYVSYGFLISFAFIPIHELIHALVYKLVGAKKTSFDVNLKKFYFLAIADKFVANKREFQWVAITPYLVVVVTTVNLFFFVNDPWKITMLTVLLVHSSFCSGDFSLLSYFEFHKEKEIVTYDDRENKISFFYVKEKLN